MSESTSLGAHVLLDYIGYSSPRDEEGLWMLQVLRKCVFEAEVREVHSHVESFDGEDSPPGFAAVVLIDESHVSAHCYSDSGLLAIDVFTCGDDDPDHLADLIDAELISAIPSLRLINRNRVNRFLGA